MITSNIGPSIAIIGIGNVGSTLARKWSNAGYKIYLASRHFDKTRKLADDIGARAEAVSVAEAAKKGDIIVLAVPFKAEPSLSKAIGEAVTGKILLNCDNAFGFRDGSMADEAIEQGVAYYSSRNFFPNVRMVRAFNAVPMVTLTAASNEHPVQVPFATDSENTVSIIEELIWAANGVPVRSGNIKDSKQFDYHG